MSLNLVVGPMWAGKSSYILSKIRRYKAIGWDVYVITNALDHRYGHFVISNHDNDQFPAVSVRNLLPLRTEEKYKQAKLIILEEAQFFQDLLTFVLKAVEEDGKHLIVVGLDGDSERRPFGDVLKLIPYCDSIEKITSLCTVCSDGTPALFSYRVGDSTTQVAVGSEDLYQPLCRKHYLEKKQVQEQ